VVHGGLGHEAGIQIGDEIHLLDAEITAAVQADPDAPYTGVLRYTRGDEVLVAGESAPEAAE
jgi:hypothetical protein